MTYARGWCLFKYRPKFHLGVHQAMDIKWPVALNPCCTYKWLFKIYLCFVVDMDLFFVVDISMSLNDQAWSLCPMQILASAAKAWQRGRMRISLEKSPGWQGLVTPLHRPTERWRRSWGNTPNNLQHLTFSCRMLPGWEVNMLSVQFYSGSFNSCLKCSKRTNSSRIPNVQKFLHFPGSRLPKWTAWMEAWWLPFLISWGIWMNPLALSIDPCFMGVGGMGGSPSIRQCRVMPKAKPSVALAIGGFRPCRRPRK